MITHQKSQSKGGGAQVVIGKKYMAALPHEPATLWKVFQQSLFPRPPVQPLSRML